MKGEGSYTRLSTLLRIVGGATLGVALAAGVPAAQAQGWYDHDRDDQHDQHYDNDRDLGGRDVRQVGMVNGYSEGFEHGLIDRRNGESFNYQHSEEYRAATEGYNSSWGNLRTYQMSFRQGYSQGYSDAYYGRSRNRDYDRDRAFGYRDRSVDGYSSYPGYSSGPTYGYGGYSDATGDRDRDDVARMAAQNGYSAGYERGAYDAQQRNRPNPQGHGAYQFGFDGYDPNWGSASTYQSNYRAYFVQGYNDGFNRRRQDSRYFRRF